MQYLRGVYESRYFWFHLAQADLRARWRRSFFGILWTILQPLGMTALISIVFSKMLGSDITTYAPYILSGILAWELIIANTTGGALSFVQADAYIKQVRHPLAIYTLRNIISSLCVFTLASISLFGWVLVVMPENFGITWLAVITILPVSIVILWPASTILSYISVKYRDVPHMLALIMQALWFVSPVYFEEKLFRQGGLDFLVDYNPVYHFLEIIRAPLLSGDWPTAMNYFVCIVFSACLAVIAIILGWKFERKVIFYL